MLPNGHEIKQQQDDKQESRDDDDDDEPNKPQTNVSDALLRCLG